MPRSPPKKPSNKKKVGNSSSSISMRCPHPPPKKNNTFGSRFFQGSEPGAHGASTRVPGAWNADVFFVVLRINEGYVWNVTSLDTCYVPLKRRDVLKIFFFDLFVLFFMQDRSMNDFDFDIFLTLWEAKWLTSRSKWMFDKLQRLKSIVSKLQP